MKIQLNHNNNDKTSNSLVRTAYNEVNWGSVGVILNVLLKSPRDFEYQEKPSGICENKFFTLNATKISVKSAVADDNGKYIYQGKVANFITG